MKPAFKLLGSIEINPLLQKVNLLVKNGWEEYCYDPGPPYNEMNKIQCLDMVILFSLPEKDNCVLNKIIYNEELLKLFKEDIELISCIYNKHYPDQEPKRITLNNMRAHSIIPPHIDFMYHYENTTKIHVPVITNPGVVFQFPTANTSLHIKVGEVMEFNNSILHSGINDSEENRIHLVIDYGKKDDPYYGDVEYDWRKYIN